jgi:glycerol-3-phosphate dehydrogenase
MFVLPWGDFSYIGTTDTDTDQGPDEVHATPADIVYLLRSANAAFPNARLSESDVLATWAGLRPLVAPGAAVSASQVPREHLILRGPGGMLTIAGGKLTTYRVMAAELVDQVTEILHQLDGRARPPRPPTDRDPLPGGEARVLEPLGQPGLELGLPSETVAYLIRCHGTECAAIFNLVRERRELSRPLVPGHPAIEAQVLHAARRELAQRVEDVLVRRLRLYYETPDHGAPAARRTAELMAEELGWDEAGIAVETERYTTMIGGAR